MWSGFPSSVHVSAHSSGQVRIQLECGRLTNMSLATIAKSGRLALQATPSGLTHAKCSQDREEYFALHMASQAAIKVFGNPVSRPHLPWSNGHTQVESAASAPFEGKSCSLFRAFT